MVQVQAVKQVSVQIDPIFLIGPVGCLSAGLFPFIYCSPGYPYYTRCRLVSSMPNLFIFSAKFDCLLLVLSRPAFSVLLKKSSFPPCRKRIFRTILGRTACQSSGRKNQPFGKKMYDQREINNLMFNLIG